MLKRTLLIMALSLTPALAQAPWRVEVRTSLPESVFYLAECLHHNPHQSTLLPAAFNKLHSQSQQAEGLSSYERFSASADQNDGMPGGRALKEVLERMAVDSADGKEFLSRSRNLLDDTQQADLAASFAYFEPAYRDSLWQQAQPELQKQKQALLDTIASSKMSEELAKTANLVDSFWSTNNPFEIALVPIPAAAEKGVVSYAHSLGYLQIVEVLQGEKMSHRLGVVFHEIVHSLWGTQRKETRVRLQRAFTGIEGRVAWQELNEGLATALGNGIFQERLDGKLPGHPWYHDETIDAYGGALVPLLKPRLESGKPLDELFCREAQQAFLKAVPGAATNPRILFRHLTADVPPGVHLQNWLSSQTRLGSWSDYRDHVDTALLLVCTTTSKASNYGAPQRDGVYCHLGNDRWTVVVVGANEAAWKAGILRLLKASKMTEGALP